MEDNHDAVERYLQTIDTALLLPVVRRRLARETVEIDDWRSELLREW